MKNKPKHLILSLSLLFLSTSLFAGNFTEQNQQESSLTLILILFLLFDIFLGVILIFGKIRQTRKKHRSFNYLKSHYL